MFSYIFFAVSGVCGGLIIALSIRSIASKSAQYWPPPNANSWQQKSFLILFRTMFLSLIVLTALEFEVPATQAATLQLSVGVILALIGYGLALISTYSLGWRTALGDKNDLRINGLYALSRNPIYVASWLGQIGWAMIANSMLVNIILVLWALMYLVAPFLEEPWLEKTYGEAFRQYKTKVRRFL